MFLSITTPSRLQRCLRVVFFFEIHSDVSLQLLSTWSPGQWDWPFNDKLKDEVIQQGMRLWQPRRTLCHFTFVAFKTLIFHSWFSIERTCCKGNILSRFVMCICCTFTWSILTHHISVIECNDLKSCSTTALNCLASEHRHRAKSVNYWDRFGWKLMRKFWCSYLWFVIWIGSHLFDHLNWCNLVRWELE